MSLSLWRRKHPPCEDGHGGAAAALGILLVLFPPAYPAYASPPSIDHVLLPHLIPCGSSSVVVFCLICARVGHQSVCFVTRVFYPIISNH